MRWLLLLLVVVFGGGECGNPHYPVDDRQMYISQSFRWRGHVGVDLNAAVGTRVYAVLDGKVIVALEDSRVYGRMVEILHPDGYASLYAHLSVIYVQEGDSVKGGTLIGLSGGDPGDKVDGDGWSSGAHLHFEVRHKDHLTNNLYNVDPLVYVIHYLMKCEMCKRVNRYPE